MEIRYDGKVLCFEDCDEVNQFGADGLVKLGILKKTGNYRYTITENLKDKMKNIGYDCLNCAEIVMRCVSYRFEIRKNSLD